MKEPVNQMLAGESGSPPVEAPPRTTRLLLVAAVITAALVRIAWAARHGLAIDQEGAEYARIAENLLAGRGYVGIFNNGTQLNFPPLFPMMIAGLSLVLPNTELAARAINIACGALLVLPMFRITDRLFGRRTANAVAALVVFHPVLIAVGASTFAEGPYLTLLMAGLFWLIRWVDSRRTSASLMAGMFFGLAYLVRPEAFVMVGVFVALGLGAALLVRGAGRRPILLGALGLGASFAVVAAPNVVFLTLSTGKVRIEAKGTLAYQWGSRINAGMPYEEAANGIGEDLSDQGVFMRPNLEVINSASYTTREYLAYLLTAARRNIPQIRDVIVNEPAFGSYFFFALMVLGLFGAPWEKRQLAPAGILLATTAMTIVVLLTVQQLWFRYFYSLLGLGLIWGAKGADILDDWARNTLAGIGARPALREAGGRVFKWASLVAVLGLALRNLPDVSQFHESLSEERVVAGRWLAAQSTRPAWIMDTGLQVAYYAKGDLMFLPYAGSDLALRYIAKRHPDYIVLHSIAKEALPYTKAWFDQGIPDKRAVLVYDQSDSPREHIRIYRWMPTP